MDVNDQWSDNQNILPWGHIISGYNDPRYRGLTIEGFETTKVPLEGPLVP